ncbi:hypothetical protein ECHHL_0221 [Ehrlichia chaffeensis str. Heartland]|uniref:Uncharacterized protein n=1 Tax=Ehrlichia chaffeensis (strain ATCC CRL-10679 / Arkansas) TaxID=205920 RepID=Q2GHJ7_EHRCR|nr:hypothetical protein ECH_0265 [Ehrlichia chaffeensis str. Arkansas]AHX03387.1 hypothetical protein ECHHL_0221 [Ehrlichia chaffeensis str. Heartland]AHX05892.1 hypothetical protein ECHJAX_0836 [Ehrlichia chaffeensis str. Jax]AHX06884.1 hypothetical protein ECHLIB_0840 [Ehrlichia chaffeensis str. Liberty]AHX07874.1 hypothetical protein ECHOSC_0229 [Ehrlichia chaffeensis str. Osceola]AHX08218.1 hypothetical protein ECHSTV_0826 [Ehrlichia chaffeensis str. Saint Vincent]AHX09705.1 hypothetical 
MIDKDKLNADKKNKNSNYVPTIDHNKFMILGICILHLFVAKI